MLQICYSKINVLQHCVVCLGFHGNELVIKFSLSLYCYVSLRSKDLFCISSNEQTLIDFVDKTVYIFLLETFGFSLKRLNLKISRLKLKCIKLKTFFMFTPKGQTFSESMRTS